MLKEVIKDPTSEEIVNEYFQTKGYTVAIGDNEYQDGFDLVAIKGTEYITVEVKTACKVPEKNSWRVRGVSDFAKNSDVIAIVLPNKNIHFESMKAHLKNCSPTGDRHITMTVKCCGLE